VARKVSSRRRILMVCLHFPVAPGQSYMTTELAEALAARGDEVEVLVLDWQAPTGTPPDRTTLPSGIIVTRCAPREIGWAGEVVRGASKFVWSGRHVARTAAQLLDLSCFDIVLAWMPAIAVASLLPKIMRAGIRHRLLFIWDFFPDHHQQIGRIPAGLPFRVAKWWEQRQLGRFTAILCTLPGNAVYLRQHYRVRPDQRVLVTPIWSDTTPLQAVDCAITRARYALPRDRPIAIFGGQITDGRGFDQMLAAAATAAEEGAPLLFVFVGDGRLAPTLREAAARQENIRWLPAMPRAAYLDLLTACDVGMAVTVPGVTSFSMPTKTIDYLRAGLPVIVALEEGSDFAALIRRYGVGTAVAFNQPRIFQREATFLATDLDQREKVRASAPLFLDEVFDVRHTVAAIDAAVAPAALRALSSATVCSDL
jgi:glycosyltransferase involved in cell wall biosynthesis